MIALGQGMNDQQSLKCPSFRARLWSLRHVVACGAVTLTLTSGCSVRLDDEPSAVQPDVEVRSARELCVAAPPPSIERGGAFSLEFSQGAMLIFAETIENGAIFSGSSAALAGTDPCDPATDVRDGAGNLAPLIALTPEEALPREDGASIRLWPTGGFVHDDAGYVFYDKVLFYGYFDTVVLGTGVATVRYGELAKRVTVGAYAHEPTLLWLAPQGWGKSVALGPDGLAYVYGCLHLGPWNDVCRVARVAPEQAGDADAYEYWDGERWSDRADNAAPILDELQSVSVTHRPALGGFVAVLPGYLENRVLARIAAQPQGPFGKPVELYKGTPPEQFWIGDVRVHDQPGPRGGLLTSYQTRPADAAFGMRWVEVEVQ
jgi:hypothetical protein